MIDIERTKENMKLIQEIQRFGYPRDILNLILKWNSREKKYKQLKLFKVFS